MSGEDAPRGQGRSSKVGLVIVTLVAVGLLAGPLFLLLGDDAPETPMRMGDIGGTAVDLDTLDPALAGLYRDAREHGDHFQEIPCFCGCQEGRLEHRHLLDCFVLQSGEGWESHAKGCGVCQGEAQMALRLLDKGTPPEEVRAKIIDAFGMPEGMSNL